jgi:hypothetical protein
VGNRPVWELTRTDVGSGGSKPKKVSVRLTGGGSQRFDAQGPGECIPADTDADSLGPKG